MTMTVDQFIALAASVAGFVSAVATLLTVREMRRQQSLAFLPDVFLSSAGRWYGISRASHKCFSMPYRWLVVHNSWSEEGDQAINAVIRDVSEDCRHEGEEDDRAINAAISLFSEDKRHEREYKYRIDITNVGRGIAKNIKVEWDFPLRLIESDFKAWLASIPLYSDEHVSYRTTPDQSDRDGEFGFHGKHLGLNHGLWNKYQTLNYLLPHQDSRSHTPIAIPSAVVLAFLARAWILRTYDDHEVMARAPEMWSLFALITWEDDTGHLHSVRYELVPRAEYSQCGNAFYAILSFSFNRLPVMSNPALNTDAGDKPARAG